MKVKAIGFGCTCSSCQFKREITNEKIYEVFDTRIISLGKYYTIKNDKGLYSNYDSDKFEIMKD